MGKHVSPEVKRRPKHEETLNITAATRIKEHQAWALKQIGQFQTGFGKHRAVESFNPMTGKYTHVPADHMPEDAA